MIDNYDHRYAAFNFVGTLENKSLHGRNDYYNFTIVEALKECKLLAVTSADAILGLKSRYVNISELTFKMINNFT